MTSEDLNSSVILFPDFLKIKEDVEKLRTEVSMLLLERDELRFVECKNIEMAYMLALGSIEYKAYKLHCDVLRIKRKIELVQMKINRQEKIIVSALEEILDEEFAEYRQKLDEQIEKMNSALDRSKGEALTAEEAKELRKLYRGIVKALHPDINPDVTPAQIQLFRNAVQAYENGDLNSLRIISEMVAEPVVAENNESAMSTLVKEKERLIKTLEFIHKQIDEIKSEFPYTEKELVRSPEMIEERRGELEQLISDLKTVYEVYSEKLEEMLR